MQPEPATTTPPMQALYQRIEALERENAALRAAAAVAEQIVDTANFLARIHDLGPEGTAFPALARHLAAKLGADHLCIDRLASEELPAAILAQIGPPLADVITDLHAVLRVGAPEHSPLIIPAGLRERLPADHPLHAFAAEGAVAVTLRAASGAANGRLLALCRRPLADPGLAASLIELVTAWASAELGREQAAALLRASEARWSFALEGAGEGIWEWNIETGQRRYSRRLLEISGYSRDDPATDFDDWERRLHPDDLPRMLTDMAAHMRGQTPAYVNEHRVRGKDGSWKWVVARGMVISRDAEGNPLRLIGTTTDIGARRQAEERLLWNQSLQRLIAGASPLAFYVFDHHSGEILYFNHRFCQLWGIEHLDERMRRGELKHRDIVDECLARLVDAPAFIGSCKPQRSEASLAVIDDELGFRDGRTVRRYSTHIRDAHDRYLGRFFMFEDITDRKHGELARRESEAKFSAAFDHAAIGMALVSPQGQWLRVNQATCDLLGYTADELLTRSFQDLTHPDDLAADLAHLQQTLAGARATYQMEKRYIHRDGHCVWGLLSVSAVRDPGGAPRFLISQIVDITARKRAELALKESEDKFSAAFSSSPVAMLIQAVDGTIIEANRGLCELIGFSRQEMLGHNLVTLGIVTEELRDRALAELARGGGSLRNFEITVRHRDGSPREIIFSGEVLPIGGVPHRLGTVLDVTARRRTEEALRVSTQLLEASQSIARLGGWELDLVTNSLFWTAETYRIHETSPEEYTPTGDTALGHYLPASQALLAAASARGEGFDLELELLTAKGRRIDVRTTGTVTLQDGRAVKLTGIFQDITDRKQAELTLRESEQRLGSIVDSAMDAIITVDESQRILVFNAAAGVMFRCRPDEALGQPLERFMPTRFRADHTVQVREFAGEGPRGGARAQVVGLRADGEEFPAEVSRSHVEVQGRRIFSVILRDISARLAAEAARDALAAQLRVSQKMEAIGTLASGIAHDFNNILGAIYGYTELAKYHAADNPEIGECLDEVSTATSRAAALVRQILAFSRQEKLQRQALRLGPVIQEVLQLLRAAMPSSISFAVSLAPDAHAVLANATQIHQVVMNLGTNAAHAMRDRTGRMTLMLENCPVDAELAATVADLRPGPYVRLTVSDTGHGMDRETMERIFDPFFTTKAPGEGTGLGLSVVHGIIRGHEGAITVRSAPGEGTTFELYFPAVSATPAAIDVVGAAPRGHGERILFVDDEEALGRVGQRILERLGYIVEVTTRPQLALAAVLARPDAYALVITDLTMPELRGTDLALRLRQIRPDLPILLTSGYSADLSPASMQAAGIREVLLKPFSAEELGRAVQRLLA